MCEPAADPAISYDLSCPRCGYNLRGLGPGGHCPECGQEIIVALGDKLLRFSDCHWLQTVLYGIKAEFAWLILLPVALILASTSSIYLSAIFAVLDVLLFAIACLFLAKPDPATDAGVSSWALRIAAPVSLLGVFGWVVSSLPPGRWGGLALFSAGLFVVVPGLLFKVHKLHQFNRELPPAQQTEILILVYWFVGLAVMLCVLVILDMVFAGFGIAILAIGLAFILVLIALCAYLAALVLLLRSIARELTMARSMQ